jgi:hypothetical protein
LTYAGAGVESGTVTVFVVTFGEAGELEVEATGGRGVSPSGVTGDAPLAAAALGGEAGDALSSALASGSGAEELVSAAVSEAVPPAEELAAPESLAA